MIKDIVSKQKQLMKYNGTDLTIWINISQKNEQKVLLAIKKLNDLRPRKRHILHVKTIKG